MFGAALHCHHVNLTSRLEVPWNAEALGPIIDELVIPRSSAYKFMIASPPPLISNVVTAMDFAVTTFSKSLLDLSTHRRSSAS